MHVGNTVVRRRQLLKGAVLGTALAFTPGIYRQALAAPTTDGPGPYGPLQAPDANGVQLPAGFTSRIIAVGGATVAGTDYVWPASPDGSACFPKDDGGYFYVCNSEVAAPVGGGGASGIEFADDGSVVRAYSVLEGTTNNCAGGPTPWGTWLSCEEAQEAGQVWECQPDGSAAGVALPALGFFNHEAVAVDPDNEVLYLTEDQPNGLFYRFLPDAYPDLTGGGQLQAASLDEDGLVTWLDVDPSPGIRARAIPLGATEFDGGEGIWFDQLGPGQPGYVYFTTKGDNVVWVHDITTTTITKLYDAADFDEPVLTGVDNVTVAPSGDVLVAEDGGNLEIVLISADEREAAPLVRLPGTEHQASEITGPSFSPDGSRLYFSSQRGGLDGPGEGVTYEVTGPFRLQRVGIAAVGSTDEPSDAAVDDSGSEDAPAGDGTTDPAPDPTGDDGADRDTDADGAPGSSSEPTRSDDGAATDRELAATGGGTVPAGLATVAAALGLRRGARSASAGADPAEQTKGGTSDPTDSTDPEVAR